MKIRVPIIKDTNDKERKVPIRSGSLTLMVVISFISLFVIWLYASWKINNSENLANIASVKVIDDEAVNKNLSKLAKKMWLPKESKPPRIFEISDPQLLQEDQPFYNGSEEGDILVVFDESNKAIIYSPKRDIIINSGPITYKEKQKELISE